MAWHGYFYIKISDSLSEAKLIDAITGMLEMGNYPKYVDGVEQNHPNTNTAFITHYVRKGRRFIFEVVLPSGVTKAKVVTKLANKLGYTEQQILNNIDEFQVPTGNDREARRQATRSFMITNKAIWFIEK